jgi:anaerobic selenocysteine-containing dehydrogenase
MRACALLPAVTGNLGKPGAGVLYLNWNLAQRHIDETYLTAPHLCPDGLPRLSHMDLAACLDDPARAQALLAWNINTAASNPQQARLRQALTRSDLFTVVLDLFPTDTTDFADFVLPAASFLEFDDLVAGYFHLTLAAQVKAMEPLGEALPNQEIFRRLARAMGYTEPELYESDASILTTLLHRANLGESFASLATKGMIPVPLEPVIQFADRTFPTPSGRIEIASARAAADGHPRVPLPLADPRPAGGRLRLLSPASPWHLNDSFANVAKIVARVGPATIALHPTDAAERGLAEGSEALVTNEVGHLALRVTLAETLPGGSHCPTRATGPSKKPLGRMSTF